MAAAPEAVGVSVVSADGWCGQALSAMDKAASILKRHDVRSQQTQKQAAAAVAGGGVASEGGGLLDESALEISDDAPPASGINSEAQDWYKDKFQLRIFGKRLYVKQAKYLLYAGSALIAVLLISLLVSLVTGDDDGCLSERSCALERSGKAHIRYRMLVKKDCIDFGALDDWALGFERSLVDALNDEHDGLSAYHEAGDAVVSQLVLQQADVAVAKVVEDPDPHCVTSDHLTCTGSTQECLAAGARCIVQDQICDDTKRPPDIGGQCSGSSTETARVTVYIALPSSGVQYDEYDEHGNLQSTTLVPGVDVAMNLEYQSSQQCHNFSPCRPGRRADAISHHCAVDSNSGCCGTSNHPPFCDDSCQTHPHGVEGSPHTCRLLRTSHTDRCDDANPTAAIIHDADISGTLNAALSNAHRPLQTGGSENGPCHESCLDPNQDCVTCGAHATCIDTGSGGHECFCEDGYEPDPVHGSCNDPQGLPSSSIAQAPSAGDHIYATPTVSTYSPCSDAQEQPQVCNNQVPGYTTYRLFLQLNQAAQAHNIYALFGDTQHPIKVPPAWQAAPPFGTNVGGVNPSFAQFSPDVVFDSFLSIGEMQGPPGSSLLGTIGINFDAWTDTVELQGSCKNSACPTPNPVSDGAVFWMDPDRSTANRHNHPDGRIPVGQLTLRDIYVDGGNGDDTIVRLGAQGRHGEHADWQESNFRWCRCRFQDARDGTNTCQNHAPHCRNN